MHESWLSCFMVKYEYSRNMIFIWLDKHEENYKITYFIGTVEDGHMAKPYEPCNPINTCSLLPLIYHDIRGHKQPHNECKSLVYGE